MQVVKQFQDEEKAKGHDIEVLTTGLIGLVLGDKMSDCTSLCLMC